MPIFEIFAIFVSVSISCMNDIWMNTECMTFDDLIWPFSALRQHFRDHLSSINISVMHIYIFIFAKSAFFLQNCLIIHFHRESLLICSFLLICNYSNDLRPITKKIWQITVGFLVWIMVGLVITTEKPRQMAEYVQSSLIITGHGSDKFSRNPAPVKL